MSSFARSANDSKAPYSVQSSRSAPLSGDVTVPGDKSISHRGLMLGSLAVGQSRITGLLEGDDVLATAAAMRAMGARIDREADGAWVVNGVGVGGLAEPHGVLDMGNSGTSARLLMGLVASHPMTATFSGDASLSKRPMGRVITPLEKIGATFSGRAEGRLPLTVRGTAEPMPVRYVSLVASAQVKSAILLAGLNTPGVTTVEEVTPTRDHSERMLSAMGAGITTQPGENGRHLVSIEGQPDLRPINLEVPGDISSAAFLIVAALVVPGSEIRLVNVGLNPLRTGLLDVLEQMGADISIENRRAAGGEPVGDIFVRHGPLKAVTMDPRLASRLIDECPVLFVAASYAQGTSRFTGLSELRVKESDRLSAMAAALSANGVKLEERDDGMAITGGPVSGGGRVTTHLDHRIAMASLVLGLAAEDAVAIDDARPISTSFPGFIDLLRSLGARVSDS